MVKRTDWNGTFHVASYGWRDNDPLGRVIALDKATCERETMRLMREEVRSAKNNDDDDIDADDLVWFGVHEYSIEQLFSDVLNISDHDDADALCELIRVGVAYV